MLFIMTGNFKELNLKINLNYFSKNAIYFLSFFCNILSAISSIQFIIGNIATNKYVIKLKNFLLNKIYIQLILFQYVFRFRYKYINLIFFSCHLLAMSNAICQPIILFFYSVNIFYLFLNERNVLIKLLNINVK